jgi:hypothetical protein
MVAIAMKTLLIACMILVSACADSPASQLFVAPTSTAIVVPDTEPTPETAYYLGIYDACVLFGRAHFAAQLPDPDIESEIDAVCLELAQASMAADMWGDRR